MKRTTTIVDVYKSVLADSLNDLDNYPTVWEDSDLINALAVIDRVRDTIANEIMGEDDEVTSSVYYDAQAMTREYTTADMAELIELERGGECSAILDCLLEEWQYYKS